MAGHTKIDSAPSRSERGIARAGVVAVLRGGRAECLRPACETLLDNGVRALEITTNTPEWTRAIATLSKREDALVGAGTVLTREEVLRAAEAGARFVFCPNVDSIVGEAARDAGIEWFPGALTPTEIRSAHVAGASAVKVFPVSAVGGPGYLSAVLAPLDGIELIPTGGIGLDDIAAYFSAGAAAVGLGSPLVGDALRGGSLVDLASRARRAVEAARGRH